MLQRDTNHLRLEWMHHQKRLSMVSMAKNLVEEYMSWFVRTLSVKSFTDIPGEFFASVPQLNIYLHHDHVSSGCEHSEAKAPSPALPPGSGNAFLPEVNPPPKHLVLVRLDLNCPNVPD